MQSSQGWLRRFADNVAVGLLSAMFLAFVLQVTSRYVFNHPLSWTLELCLTLWLWTVLWGSAFCLNNEEHIRFDMLYYSVRPQLRRVFAAISALAIVVGLACSLPGSWSFVSFLIIKKSATMRIPLAYVFSIYLAFLVATIVAYGWRLRQILTGKAKLDHPEHAAS